MPPTTSYESALAAVGFENSNLSLGLIWFRGVLKPDKDAKSFSTRCLLHRFSVRAELGPGYRENGESNLGSPFLREPNL